VRLQLDTIGDRDEATALRGKIVLAQAGILQPLAAGEFYWHELIGCEVQTEAGDVVGTVREIWETGAHDVLVVRNEAGRQNLIPTAREITQKIDLENQRIVVAGLPGLIDLGELGEEDQEGGA
jgi:16S rRNA processing protein RimM